MNLQIKVKFNQNKRMLIMKWYHLNLLNIIINLRIPYKFKYTTQEDI